jgi:hypothetical protein
VLVPRQGLGQIARYVARLCACRVDANLHIGGFAGDLAVLLARRTGRIILYPLEGFADKADAVKDFFDERGLEPLSGATMDYEQCGTWVRVAGYPMPAEPEAAARCTTDLMRLVGGLTHDTGLGFTYVEDRTTSTPPEVNIN